MLSLQVKITRGMYDEVPGYDATGTVFKDGLMARLPVTVNEQTKEKALEALFLDLVNLKYEKKDFAKIEYIDLAA